VRVRVRVCACVCVPGTHLRYSEKNRIPGVLVPGTD
jgi:hypothetical protein